MRGASSGPRSGKKREAEGLPGIKFSIKHKSYKPSQLVASNQKGLSGRLFRACRSRSGPWTADRGNFRHAPPYFCPLPPQNRPAACAVTPSRAAWCVSMQVSVNDLIYPCLCMRDAAQRSREPHARRGAPEPELAAAGGRRLRGLGIPVMAVPRPSTPTLKTPDGQEAQTRS